MSKSENFWGSRKRLMCQSGVSIDGQFFPTFLLIWSPYEKGVYSLAYLIDVLLKRFFISKCNSNHLFTFVDLPIPSTPLLKKDSVGLLELDFLLDGFQYFEELIGYRFKDRSYLLQAFSHASYYPNRLTGKIYTKNMRPGKLGTTYI